MGAQRLALTLTTLLLPCVRGVCLELLDTDMEMIDGNGGHIENAL
jgi:hypothetical protein